MDNDVVLNFLVSLEQPRSHHEVEEEIDESNDNEYYENHPYPNPRNSYREPENIRKRLTKLEVDFREIQAAWLLDLIPNGTCGELGPLLQYLDCFSQKKHEFDGKYASLIEKSERINEEELRRFVWSHTREIDHILGCYEREPMRFPESDALHKPWLGSLRWRRWTETDVMLWVRRFIFQQDQLNRIKNEKFTGKSLREFLDSETKWKEKGFPFGLYIILLSNLNRVINARLRIARQYPIKSVRAPPTDQIF